jgi:uncharacterized protein (DUF1697 family)
MRYVALLRAIANTPMAPFRDAMTELGFAEVESLGMSGNLIFTADGGAAGEFEPRIAARFGTDAFVRTATEMARTAADHPFRDQSGASVLFLASAPSTAKRRALQHMAFDGSRPVLKGKALHFTYPSTVAGKRTPVDFERLLGVRGTARSARIVEQLAARMRGASAQTKRPPR